MENFITDRIRQLCLERNWSIYRLSQESGVPLSTLNTLMKSHSKTPSIPTLENICKGFSISLSQFFQVSDNEPAVASELTQYQQTCLDYFTKLGKNSQALALAYMQALYDSQFDAGTEAAATKESPQ